MMNGNKPIHRIKHLINYLNTNVSTFEKDVGLSNGSIQTAIKRESNLKDETLNTILKRYDFINPNWLLTGDGEFKLSEEIAKLRSGLDDIDVDKLDVKRISRIVVGNQDLFLKDMLFKEFVEKVAHRKMLDIYKKNATI